MNSTPKEELQNQRRREGLIFWTLVAVTLLIHFFLDDFDIHHGVPPTLLGR